MDFKTQLACDVEGGEFLSLGCSTSTSTIGCEVEVYDSVRRGLCETSLKALGSIMHSPLPTLTLKIMNTQLQPNCTDCGPFAATVLRKKTHRQQFLRFVNEHMKNCFMTPFPWQMRRAVRCFEIRRVSVPLVCICRRPRFKDDDITSCRYCGQCFHVGLDNESACFVIRDTGKWICPLCF